MQADNGQIIEVRLIINVCFYSIRYLCVYVCRYKTILINKLQFPIMKITVLSVITLIKHFPNNNNDGSGLLKMPEC